jgi:hypothetical protein
MTRRGSSGPDVPDDLKFELRESDLTWERWRAMPDDLKFKLQEYQLDESKGKKNKILYAWWDWHFMIQDMESGAREAEIHSGRIRTLLVGVRAHPVLHQRGMLLQSGFGRGF